MSRTYHATGTGSFTRAGEVRADRRATRLANKGEALIVKDTAMFGATSEHPEGRISYEEAQKLIRNGDRIRTPDGKLHTVRASNRDELIGRLGGVITTTVPSRNPLQPPQTRTVEYRGNRSKPQTVKIVPRIEQIGTKKNTQSFGLKTPRLRVSTTQRTQKIFRPNVKIQPRSTYKPSRNSKKTETKLSRGNAKLRTNQRQGGLRPKAIRSARADNLAKKRATNARNREFVKGLISAASKVRGPRTAGGTRAPKAAKAGAKSSKASTKSVKARTSKSGSKPAKAGASKSRKGGRSGRGRSR